MVYTLKEEEEEEESVSPKDNRQDFLDGEVKPSQALYLRRKYKRTKIYIYTQPCHEWDSNPRPSMQAVECTTRVRRSCSYEVHETYLWFI
jgi:hypothetical protein